MNQPIPIQLTADEYLRWEDRQRSKSELHHGFVVAFAGGTLVQDRLALRVRDLLVTIFPAPCMTFSSDIKIKIAEDMFFYPDVSVACEVGDLERTYVDRPRVVVEVLSPSTRGYDTIGKRAAYRSLASLEAYVIVHADIRRIEIDARDAAGSWQTLLFHEYDSVLLGGAIVPVAEIYGPHVVS
ncbi:MAG: Uma2 family endonuclease [Vulcanimicrobiaceae bacterium]